MSNALLNLAWRVKLRAPLKIVLVRLADAAGKDSRCWYAIGTIAADCGSSRRLVFRHIDELETLGHLHRESRPGRPSVIHVHPIVPDYPQPVHAETSLPVYAGTLLASGPVAAEAPTSAREDTPPVHAGTPEPVVTVSNQKPRARKVRPEDLPQPGWWNSDKGIDQAARQLRIQPTSHDTYPTLKEKCFERIKRIRRGADAQCA